MFLSSYQVMLTLVEVWKNSKSNGNTEQVSVAFLLELERVTDRSCLSKEVFFSTVVQVFAAS